MSRATERANDPIQLAHEDGGRQVVMTPGDFDKFVWPATKAVSACVNHAAYESFQKSMRQQFEKLYLRIMQWCAKRPEVQQALFAPREDEARYLLIFVTSGTTHNFELDDPVSDLDLELFRDFPEYPLSILTVPQEPKSAVAAFINPEEAIKVYANPSRTQGNR
jgi:hypothetical protein